VLAVGGGFAVALQLTRKRPDLGAEAADLFGDPGDVAGVDLDLRLAQGGADPTAVPLARGPKCHPARDPGQRRAAGNQRHLRLAGHLADGLTGIADALAADFAFSFTVSRTASTLWAAEPLPLEREDH
jgi:hypothetical protein